MNDDFETLSPEALDEALAATDARWGADLAILLAAPEDLTARCAEDVRAALLTRSVVATGTDLLSVGWQTIRLLLSSDPETSSSAAARPRPRPITEPDAGRATHLDPPSEHP